MTTGVRRMKAWSRRGSPWSARASRPLVARSQGRSLRDVQVPAPVGLLAASRRALKAEVASRAGRSGRGRPRCDADGWAGAAHRGGWADGDAATQARLTNAARPKARIGRGQWRLIAREPPR